MTEPDDGLGEALRRTLSAAASEVEPRADGLDRIRARIRQRPPRPWLLSVLILGFDRVRYWTWRGHWAWPGALPRLGRPTLPDAAAQQAAPSGVFRSLPRRDSHPAPGVRWLRPVAVLGGIMVVAGVSLSVQPFRQAIIQASATVLDGGSGSQSGIAGTEGNGTRTDDHGGPPPPGSPAGGGPGPGYYSPGSTGTAGPGSAGVAPGGTCSGPPPAGGTGTNGQSGTSPAQSATVPAPTPDPTASSTPSTQSS